ncbi:MAG: ABC-ATPase domain-containing protein [Bacilli bacterium]|nr:ABC-ATPase domain-containing protein [Bacilli bacterium]MDD3098980.1 ABC-ATPase domain-containing protein [Bacilli bacterium]
MDLFKKNLLNMHSQNKIRLTELYLDKILKIENEEKQRKEYIYKELKFFFSGINYKYPEKMVLHISIPKKFLFSKLEKLTNLPIEHYLLKYIGSKINEYNYSNYNRNKDVREKPYIEAQTTNDIIIKRNGIRFDKNTQSFILNLFFRFPLINNHAIIAKSSYKFVKEILEIIHSECINFDSNYHIIKLINIYDQQQYIRLYLKKYGYISFIANDSILPRKDGSTKQNENAVKFKSPIENEIEILFSDGSKIKGMGLKKGIIVITGGGYSGKSTILDAIQFGIYNHEFKDGREFCITDESAFKIVSEDGRYISNMNLSAFFKYIGNEKNVKKFSTDHASGSVSQAANILDAISMNCKLMLFDEDRSAINFMIKDDIMREIILDEAIIPFIDRIQEIYERFNISFILVIGGSSAYIKYSTEVLLMDKYVLTNITSLCKNISFTNSFSEIIKGTYKHIRTLSQEKPNDFIYYNIVKNENSKYIQIGDYKANITYLSSIISDYQINYLVYIIMFILSRNEYYEKNLYLLLKNTKKNLSSEIIEDFFIDSNMDKILWLEEVKNNDIFSTINRLRGLVIK